MARIVCSLPLAGFPGAAAPRRRRRCPHPKAAGAMPSAVRRSSPGASYSTTPCPFASSPTSEPADEAGTALSLAQPLRRRRSGDRGGVVRTGRLALLHRGDPAVEFGEEILNAPPLGARFMQRPERGRPDGDGGSVGRRIEADRDFVAEAEN